MLGLVGDKNVDELSLLSFTATASDDGLPSGTLTYSLGGAVPSGAVIDFWYWCCSLGLLAEVQGPGVYTFDVVVSDGAVDVILRRSLLLLLRLLLRIRLLLLLVLVVLLLLSGSCGCG